MALQKPSDLSARDRFRTEINRNFSVIAPAGVGKTQAIVDRITQIAIDDRNASTAILPQLVVVTYTRKAAAEMYERTRAQILAHDQSPHTLTHLEQAFFGTIHSFCLELIHQFAHYLELPATITLINDDKELWLQFIRQNDQLLATIPQAVKTPLLRLVRYQDILHTARKTQPSAMLTVDNRLPSIDSQNIIAFQPTSKRTAANIDYNKSRLTQWLAQWQQGDRFIGFPDCTTGGSDFIRIWYDSFIPLRNWASAHVHQAAVAIAEAFYHYRLHQGQLRYDDMIRLAIKLTDHPIAGQQLAAQSFRIILDEAQDADQQQFSLLLALAQQPFPNTGEPFDQRQPAPGRFCMVGDPQQSIYSSRADLPAYLDIHQSFANKPNSDTLTFNVTFRCAPKITSLVNQAFLPIFAAEKNSGQVSLTPLNAFRQNLSGETLKASLSLPKASIPNPSIPKSQLQTEYSHAFTQWLAQHLPSIDTHQDLSRIAVLSPRNDWLIPISNALTAAAIPHQLHARNRVHCQQPAYAWFTSLLHCLCHPDDRFELTGVLREIYGVSDHDIATLAQETTINIITPHTIADNPAAQQLNSLHDLKNAIASLPLREALAVILSTTQLEQRLLSLPDYSCEEITHWLQQLTLQTAIAEQQNLTLIDWAAELMSRRDQPLEAPTPKAGHLQLLTCHNAKGLEWPVVILPFLFKPLSFMNESYPRLLKLTNNATALKLDRHHSLPSIESKVTIDQQQEQERLLYVTMTRARDTLIFIDDATWFKESTGSFADCLHIQPQQNNHVLWQNLATLPQPAHTHHQTAVPSLTAAPLTPSSQPLFIQRILPSSLAIHSKTTSPPKINDYQAKHQGIHYGNWWHATMEHYPWHQGKEYGYDYCQSALATCPNPHRGLCEMNRLLNSSCFHKLTGKDRVIRTEVPLCWQSQPFECIDGTIDLLCANTYTNTITIIDWKTDRINKKQTDALITAYQPQIHCYMKALQDNYPNSTISSAIYSTCLGIALEITSPCH